MLTRTVGCPPCTGAVGADQGRDGGTDLQDNLEHVLESLLVSQSFIRECLEEREEVFIRVEVGMEGV